MKIWPRVQQLALGFPETWADSPWEGDEVIKVRKKIFVFLGGPSADRIGVKLAASLEQARQFDGVQPSAYGLGKHGWSVIPLGAAVPDELVLDWVEESYRLIAPKILIARLDAPTDS